MQRFIADVFHFNLPSVPLDARAIGQEDRFFLVSERFHSLFVTLAHLSCIARFIRLSRQTYFFILSILEVGKEEESRYVEGKGLLTRNGINSKSLSILKARIIRLRKIVYRNWQCDGNKSL